MSKLKIILISFLFVFLLTSCDKNEQHPLKVNAIPIQAEVSGDILVGPSTLNDPERFVWGASVIKGDDGKYHMLYSTWEAGEKSPKFTDGWLLLSKIAYAVSDYPDRDFKFQKVILKGRKYEGDSSAWDAVSVHNPHIKKFEDQYYLYYTGSRDPGPQPPGSKAENLNKRNRIQQSQQIGVIEFLNFPDLLDGNFNRPSSPILSPRTRVKPDNIIDPSPDDTDPKPDNIIVVNPSVVRRPVDGKYLLYFKGNLYDPNWKGIHGVAVGDSPIGPFEALDQIIFDIRMADGKIASAEDPFVWYHKKHEKFYAVFKDFSGKITEGKPGLAILESLDGIEWIKPVNPFFMKKELLLSGGDTLQVNNLERPQLLLDDSGYPNVLYAACSVGPVWNKTDGSTFNVHIRLNSTRE